MGSAIHGLSAQLDQGPVLGACECFSDAQTPFDEEGILNNSHVLIIPVGTGCIPLSRSLVAQGKPGNRHSNSLVSEGIPQKPDSTEH